MQKRVGGGNQQQQQGKASNNKQKSWHRPKPKRKSSSRSWPRMLMSAVLGAAVLAGGAYGGLYLYRERYPSEQRCPPETDRFHDHCMEGRKVSLLSQFSAHNR